MGNKQSIVLSQDDYLQMNQLDSNDSPKKFVSIVKLGNCIWEFRLDRKSFKSPELPSMTLETTFKQGDKEETKCFHFTGDDIFPNDELRFLIISPPNCSSFRVNITDGDIIIPSKELSSRTYSCATRSLMSGEETVERFKQELYKTVKNLEGKKLKFVPISETSSGKSTILNAILKNNDSGYDNPFTVGNSKGLIASNNLLEFHSDNPLQNQGDSNTKLHSYTTDIQSIAVNTNECKDISLVDVPAQFMRDRNTTKLLQYFRNLVEDSEEEIEFDAVFIPIPMVDLESLKKSEEGSSVMSYFHSFLNRYNWKSQTPCVFCISQIDRLYLFEQYIKKDSTIIDISIGQDSNVNTDQRNTNREKLMKLFYEWFIIDETPIIELLGENDHIPTFFTHLGVDELGPKIHEMMIIENIKLLKQLVSKAKQKFDSKKLTIANVTPRNTRNEAMSNQTTIVDLAFNY